MIQFFVLFPGFRLLLALGLFFLMSHPAGAQTTAHEPMGFGALFGLSATDKRNELSFSTLELQSMGCLVVGSSVGIAAVVFGGAAIIVSRGQGAATVTTVAVPVLAAAMTAGCAFGSQAAPAMAWLKRNSDALFGKVIDAIPTPPPLGSVLPLR